MNLNAAGHAFVYFVHTMALKYEKKQVSIWGEFGFLLNAFIDFLVDFILFIVTQN